MRPLTATDVMNPRVLTVRDDLTVGELASFLLDKEISGAPVEDGAGKLVGVVSVTDIAWAATGRAEPSGNHPGFFARSWDKGPSAQEMPAVPFDRRDLLVRDIMNRDLYSVPEATPVSEVAEMMVDGHIHRLLVTSGERVVGIVSTSDLLGLLVEER